MVIELILRKIFLSKQKLLNFIKLCMLFENRGNTENENSKQIIVIII